MITDGTLFRDVRVFDGRSGSLGEPSQVLVRAGRIEVVAPTRVELEAATGARVLEDISLVARPETSFVLIMQGGVVVKEMLPAVRG